MKKQTYGKYLIASISLVAALSVGHSAFACSGGDEDDDQYSSIFSPEVVGDPSCTPFYRSNRYFYLDHDDASIETRADIASINASEWNGYFAGALDSSQLSALLYTISADDVQKMGQALAGTNIALPPAEAAIVSALSANRQSGIAALNYLALAKAVEPLATSGENNDNWDKSKVTPKDTNTQKLIDQANALLRTTTDSTLASRYRFQILRLYFYGKDYDTTLAYYTSQPDAFAGTPSIAARSKELAAGAAYKAKAYAEANFMFAQIFRDYAPLKKNAYLSFHPQNQDDWNKTLALAKTPSDQVALWVMYGLYADGFQAMREIHRISPKSEYLPLLLVREVNKAEESFQWLTNSPPSTSTPAYLDISAVTEIMEAGDAPKAYVWPLALGHLYGLQGNQVSAQFYLDKAAQVAPPVTVVKDQIRISTLFNFVHNLQKPDPKMGKYFARELTWLAKTPDFPASRGAVLLRYAKQQMAKVYLADGDWVRSVLLDDSATTVYFNNNKIDAIKAFLAQETVTPFDQYLITSYDVTESQLDEMKGINSAYGGDFKGAAASLANAKEPMLLANPFNIHINDCHDCDFDRLTTKIYTKATFAAKMAELAQSSEGTGPKAAQDSFLLANGFYNMSYYGNARDFYVIPDVDNFTDRNRTLSMKMAEKYYYRAAALTTDPEFKAKVIFMLAKCEENDYFTALPDDQRNDPQIYVGKAFAELKSSFSNTQYFKEILKECGYFKKYVEK